MKALLMGYYGARNLGDEMMLVCLRRWLGAQSVSVSVLSENPRQVERDHRLPAVRNWPLLGEWSWRTAWLKGGAPGVVAAIARHDALIVGGGDLVRDDLGWRGFFFTMEKVVTALLLRKKVYFVNVGLGRPTTRYGKRLLRWTLPRAEQIIVRDLRSVDVCRECGAGDRVTLAPDIVTTMRVIAKPGSATRPYLVVSLREAPDVFGECQLNESRVAGLASMLDAIVERHDLDVVFVPFQSGEIDDARIHNQVRSAMRHQARATSLAWTSSIAAIVRLFAGSRGVLAMRLHAAVLAVARKRPCLLLPYDRKLREFAKLTGLQIVEAAQLDTPAALMDVANWLTHSAPAPKAATPTADWNSLRLTAATPHRPAADARFVNSRLTKETTL